MIWEAAIETSSRELSSVLRQDSSRFPTRHVLPDNYLFRSCTRIQGNASVCEVREIRRRMNSSKGASDPGRSHSARVRMRLWFGDSSFSIAQLGPDFLDVDSPADHPPTDAVIELEIDGVLRAWNVHLPDGVTADSRRVRLSTDR